MKKVTLILILIFTTSIYSQYNLQFNRVVNEQLNANNQMVTVPEGKVWKIQAFHGNGNGNTNDPSNVPFSITKPDGTYLSYRYFYANSMQNQTIWASAGDKISMAGSLPNSVNIMALNALEFNLSSVTSSGGSGGSGVGVSSAGFSTNAIIDLEFSGLSGGIGQSVDMGSLIVPEGKIWKIVISSLSVSTSSSGVSPGSGIGGNVYVNGYLVSGEDKPIYLAAGTYQVFSDPAASGSGSTYYHTAKVGGIEYNAN